MTETPKRIGKYRIDGVLGKGAMGVVYKAHDEKIGRTVAIKTIHAHLLGEDSADEMLKRFNVEVQAVGKLSHVNIVGIYDTDEFQPDDKIDIKVPYFAMEYVEGHELAELMSKGQRYNTTQIVQIISQILDAFDYTHRNGIIHRDIKPANIFINDQGDAKIADFGIARFENSSLTKTGSIMGTPNYMSPEQCSGQVLDLRTDLFSIAAMLYEMLTGEKPFQGNAAHTIMLRITNNTPEKPSSINPSLPKLFDRLLAKALAKEPKARFQTAGEFRRALLKVHELCKDDFPGWQAVDAGESSAALNDTVLKPSAANKTILKQESTATDNATVLLPNNQAQEKAQTNNRKSKKAQQKLEKGQLAELNELLGVEAQAQIFYEEYRSVNTVGSPHKSAMPLYFSIAASLLAAIAVAAAVYVYVLNDQQRIEVVVADQTDTYVPDIKVLMGDMKAAKTSDKPLTQKQQSKLSKLLKVADMNMQAGRYIWPETSNAAYVYRLALQVQAENNIAVTGLINVCDKLVNQAEMMLQEKDYESLKAHLDAALAIFPGEQRLQAYQNKMRELAHL